MCVYVSMHVCGGHRSTLGVDIELLSALHFETDVDGLDAQQILSSQPQLHQNLSRKFSMSVHPWHCIHAFINVANQSHYIAAKHLFSLSGCEFSKFPFLYLIFICTLAIKLS